LPTHQNLSSFPTRRSSDLGRPIINLLPLEADERITSMLPVDSYEDDRYIFMATKYGVVKKTVLSSFQSQRSNGLIAVNLDEGDRSEEHTSELQSRFDLVCR